MTADYLWIAGIAADLGADTVELPGDVVADAAAQLAEDGSTLTLRAYTAASPGPQRESRNACFLLAGVLVQAVTW